MKTTILVAEDNEILFNRYQKIIAKDENYELVGYAKDGQTALELYKKLKPDIFILDLGLPKMNRFRSIKWTYNIWRKQKKM